MRGQLQSQRAGHDGSPLAFDAHFEGGPVGGQALGGHRAKGPAQGGSCGPAPESPRLSAAPR
eukprot:154706-Pyramimonas_sp.AAC.1